MIKLVALYGKPRDPAEFDRHYREVHVPLAKKIPDIHRFTIHKVVGSPQEGAPPFYCLTEVYWDDLETALKALASPDGRTSYDDVPNYATGGVTFVFTEVEDIPLGGASRVRPSAAKSAGKAPARGKRARAKRASAGRGAKSRRR